ncbi:hypothetical protein BDF19DRAFT_493508 [Syncephalis fuscata]|nr:hypothetical protein BDF19DRAFT_493508 [Syncephalis fuscata]
MDGGVPYALGKISRSTFSSDPIEIRCPDKATEATERYIKLTKYLNTYSDRNIARNYIAGTLMAFSVGSRNCFITANPIGSTPFRYAEKMSTNDRVTDLISSLRNIIIARAYLEQNQLTDKELTNDHIIISVKNGKPFATVAMIRPLNEKNGMQMTYMNAQGTVQVKSNQGSWCLGQVLFRALFSSLFPINYGAPTFSLDSYVNGLPKSRISFRSSNTKANRANLLNLLIGFIQALLLPDERRPNFDKALQLATELSLSSR